MSLVVKNGSKMRARVAASIPCPVSETDRTTYGPGAVGASAGTSLAATTVSAVRIVRAPPLGMASRALTTRLRSTCSICPRSASDRPDARAQFRNQSDVFGDHPAEHGPHVGYDGVQVDPLGGDRLPSAERQELPSQDGRPLAGGPDVVQKGPEHVRRRVMLQDQIDVAENDREQVVEVVGDAARQPADCFHPLGPTDLLVRLAIRFFRLMAGRDVAEDDGEARPVAVGGDDDFGPKLTAVGPPPRANPFAPARFGSLAQLRRRGAAVPGPRPRQIRQTAGRALRPPSNPGCGPPPRSTS